MKIVKESISFHKSKDPRLTIGADPLSEIRKFFREDEDSGFENEELEKIPDLIYLIAASEKLNIEIKEKWIKKIINVLNPKIDYSPISRCLEENVDIFSLLPIGWSEKINDGDMEIVKEKDGFKIYFNTWVDWTDFVSTGNYVSNSYISDALGGGLIYSYLFPEEFDIDEYEFKEYLLEFFKDNDKIFIEFRNLYEKIAAEKNIPLNKDLEEMIDTVFDSGAFESLKDTLVHSIQESIAIEAEGQEMKNIEEGIKSHFHLTDIKYLNDAAVFQASISFEGLANFYECYASAYKCWRYSPLYSGVSSIDDVDPTIFKESLENQLE